MAFDEELGYDPDLPRPPGDYKDGASFRYSTKMYSWDAFDSEINTAVVRITMRITGGSVAGGQTIHKWMSLREYTKLKAGGAEIQEIYHDAETKDDMEYFVARMREASRNGVEDYYIL